jgi:hypothetical protein
MRRPGRCIHLQEETEVAAIDESYEEAREGMDDALDEVDPEDRQPPSDEEAEQDDYANTKTDEEA